ncbi:hypothetical protein C8J56DRAFT_1027028 [Mycena floridula]|nr:hypothetical protein C8J56DRAFT_1027028 [Mycena floridula]
MPTAAIVSLLFSARSSFLFSPVNALLAYPYSAASQSSLGCSRLSYEVPPMEEAAQSEGAELSTTSETTCCESAHVHRIPAWALSHYDTISRVMKKQRLFLFAQSHLCRSQSPQLLTLSILASLFRLSSTGSNVLQAAARWRNGVNGHRPEWPALLDLNKTRRRGQFQDGGPWDEPANGCHGLVRAGFRKQTKGDRREQRLLIPQEVDKQGLGVIPRESSFRELGIQGDEGE